MLPFLYSTNTGFHIPGASCKLGILLESEVGLKVNAEVGSADGPTGSDIQLAIPIVTVHYSSFIFRLLYNSFVSLLPPALDSRLEFILVLAGCQS